MEFKNIMIGDLLPDKKNPRKDLQPSDPEFKKIKGSIERFGFLEPIVFNTKTKKIIGGHQRLKVLRDQGRVALRIIELGAYSWAFTDDDLKELSEQEEGAANIALNKAQGDWQMDQLVANLQEIKADGLLELTGFDDKEFDQMLRELHKDDEPMDTEPQISRAEELRKEWGTELGQMWELGDHRVLCGDCTDPAVVARVMQGEKADMVFTDPPYGISAVDKSGVLKKRYKQFENDENPDIIKELIKIIPLDSVDYFIWGGNYLAHLLPKSTCWIIWDKRGDKMMGGSSCGDQPDCEIAWTNFESRAVKKYVHVWAGWFRAGNKKDELPSKIHPTQKPVGLFESIFKDYLKKDIVLDPFLGSGTTMIACENLGRRCRGLEIDPGYVAVILQRYKDTFPGKEIKKLA